MAGATGRRVHIAALQLRFAGASLVAVLIAIALTEPGADDARQLAYGAAVIGYVTVLGIALPWERVDVGWTVMLPVLDALGVAILAHAMPLGGLSALAVFPLMWMARSLAWRELLGGVALCLGLLWASAASTLADLSASERQAVVTMTATISLALLFATAVTYAVRQRVDAQRVLLHHQTVMLEQALARTRLGERTLREVLDAVDFSVLGLDHTGETVTTNRASIELLARLGLPLPSSIDRLPLFDERGDAPVAREDLPHVRALRGETVESQTYWLGGPGDARAALSVSVRTLAGEDGAPDRLVLVARDVTAELQAIRARDDLVSSVSHELRTPLSSIIGFLDLAMEDPTLPDEPRGMLEVAAKNAQRMLALINDMVDSRAVARGRRLQVRMVPFDLVPVLREAVDAIMPLARDRLISVSMEIPLELRMTGDPLRLRQVVDNLLSNAVKYNREGGRLLLRTREVLSEETGRGVEIAVTDTGYGMTNEDTRRLFERFYRTDAARQSTVRGSGLGLAITRELVELHGGTIGVRTAPDEGTTMTVALPADHPEITDATQEHR